MKLPEAGERGQPSDGTLRRDDHGPSRHRTELEGARVTCGLWVDPPGQVWADYVHDVDELVMVVEGDVEFEIEGAVRRLRAGEELMIPARAKHTVRNLGSGGKKGSRRRLLYWVSRGQDLNV